MSAQKATQHHVAKTELCEFTARAMGRVMADKVYTPGQAGRQTLAEKMAARLDLDIKEFLGKAYSSTAASSPSEASNTNTSRRSCRNTGMAPAASSTRTLAALNYGSFMAELEKSAEELKNAQHINTTPRLESDVVDLLPLIDDLARIRLPYECLLVESFALFKELVLSRL